MPCSEWKNKNSSNNFNIISASQINLGKMKNRTKNVHTSALFYLFHSKCTILCSMKFGFKKKKID